eukprot:Selendium_serpulae@DN5905_c0_g1_i2.p1
MELDRAEGASFRPQILAKALTELKRNDNASPFNQPVDWEELGLVDYPKVIRNPMDLKTVGLKLRRREYSNDEEFWQDIDLIWRNCQAYNEENSGVWEMSVKMQQLSVEVKQKYAEVHTPSNQHSATKAHQKEQPNVDADADAGRNQLPDSRLRRQQATLCAKIGALSSLQLQYLFQFMAQEFPEALECSDSQLTGRGSVTRHRSSHADKVVSSSRVTLVLDRLDEPATNVLRSFVAAVKKSVV